MHYSTNGRNINAVLPKLMGDLAQAAVVPSRNGETKELGFTSIWFDRPWQREIVIPHRKANIAAQIAETMWVLAGRNDVEFLSNYLPRAGDFSDDGETWRAGYGPRLRRWEGTDANGSYAPTDQLAEVVRLLREDPGTRRAVMSIWDPSADYVASKDVPCNNWLHFLARDSKLHLHVAIRSNDAMWGWSGINAFEWSVLLEIVAAFTGLEVGELHFSVTSMHLYEQHYQRAAEIAKVEGWGYEEGLIDSPRFSSKSKTVAYDLPAFDEWSRTWFAIEEKIREGSQSLHQLEQLVSDFPEPMMRSWLYVILWWWANDMRSLSPLVGTRLFAACRAGVQPKKNVMSGPFIQVSGGGSSVSWLTTDSLFVNYVTKLHDEKHVAYKDSWKKRGEMLGIMANIARKIDRLGQNGAGETAADTAIDLLVYLAKYRWWLYDNAEAPQPVDYADHSNRVTSDGTSAPNTLMRKIDNRYQSIWTNSQFPVPQPKDLETALTDLFDQLELVVSDKRDTRYQLVDKMLPPAYELARQLWEAESHD